MKRFLTSLLVFLLISGCSKGKGETHQSGTKLKEAEKVVKAILKPLSVRGVELKKVEPTDEVRIPGFETFKVDLIDKRNHRELFRYVFINPEKKVISLQMFKYSFKDKNVLLKPIKPKVAERSLKIDTSFLKEIDKELSEAKIPHVVGRSEKRVYVIWDVFCPFCYKHFNQIEEIAKKNGVEIHLIPLAVHGENSVKGLVYYTKLARDKGVVEALKELYRMGNGNFTKYTKELKGRLEREKTQTEDYKELTKTLKEVEIQLIKNGVRATPTLIYVPPGESKGTIHVGFIPIEELIKNK